MPISTVSSSSGTSFAQAIVDPKLFDLERVEVLRGPQGTLFGSSSMGGTVRLITRQPNVNEFEFRANGEVSSTKDGGENYTINGSFNTPLVEDKLGFRLITSYTNNDGFIDRLVGDFPSTVDLLGGPLPVAREATEVTRFENVNDEETFSIRGALKWQPTDNLTIQPYIFYQQTEQNGKQTFDFPPGEMDQRRRFDVPELFDDQFTLYSLTANWDIGPVNIVSSSSYIDRDFNNLEDLTPVIDVLIGGALPGPVPAPEFVDLEDFTQEIRISSTYESDLQWILGFYYKNADSASGFELQEPDILGLPVPLALVEKESRFEEFAVFGEATYSITDRLDVTLGARWFDNEFSFDESNFGVVFEAFVDSITQTGSTGDDGVNPRILISYDVLEDAQIYATAARGSRPGGTNTPVPAGRCAADLGPLGLSNAPLQYDGDSLWNYEVGVKSRLADQRVTLNVAAFYIDWSDIQQIISLPECGFAFVDNAGSARSTGFEFELSALLTDNLRVDAGVGFADAELTDAGQGTGLQDGQALLDAPKWTINVSAEYTYPLSNGELFALASFSYVDEALDAFSDGQGFDVVKPSFSLFDFRVGYSTEHWEFALFIDNAFNKEAIFTQRDTIGELIPVFRRFSTNRPRTIGVSLTAHY